MQWKGFDADKQNVLMNYFLLLIGLVSLIFSFWTAYGLYCRHTGTLPERQANRNWWLGVCADFSKTVGIPVSFVRFIILLYSTIGVGVVFYLIYHVIIRNRKVLPPVIPERELQITKIESHYYRS